MENHKVLRYRQLETLLRSKGLSTFETREFFNLIREALGKGIANTTCVSCVRQLMDKMNTYIDKLPKEVIVEEVKEESNYGTSETKEVYSNKGSKKTKANK
jgi:hypothetical protein